MASSAMFSCVTAISGIHTECQKGVLLRGRNDLNCKDKQGILDKHYQLRQLVANGGVLGQPMAVNMLQMVIWGDSNLVGCGYVYFQNGTRYNYMYVCNYGPGGNYIDMPPYEYGPPECTAPGTTPSTSFPGLCLVEGVETDRCV